MTKTGFGFIAAGGFVYLLASETQIGWLYLFDAIIWSLLLVSAVLPWWSLKPLQVERQILLPASALRQWQLGGPSEDETIEVRLKVTNNGHLSRHFIKVVEDCPFEQPEKQQRAFFLTSLKPRSVTVFSYAATCYRRGYYPSSTTVLQCGGPLGLIVRRCHFRLPLKLTVYPAYYQMEGLPATDTGWADWGHAVKSSAAAEFYGSREYQPGDPLKYIHWRNTARVGRFMLKEFEQASQGAVTVAFETRRDFGVGRETTLEYSIRLAASLTRLCADSGRSIDIIAGEKPLRNAGWRDGMDYLAYLNVGARATLVELVATLVPGQVVVVIAPTIETKLIPVLSQLAERARGLVVVLLEGFAPDERPHDFISGLKGSNLHVISCSQGNLEAAAKELGNSLSYADKSSALTG